MQAFANSLQHILAELERLDLLIQAAVSCARQVQGGADEFQGLYIPEHEVDALLARPAGLPRWATTPGPPALPEVRAALELIATSISQRKAASTRDGIKLRLDELARLFDLTPFDTDALLICLAPEIDLRYERLYAYLQDDVTKKRPSVDLVLNLLSPSFEAKFAARSRFLPQAPLVCHHLITLFDDPSQQTPPLLGKYLKVDERVVAYLLDSDELDARLLPWVEQKAASDRLEDLLLPDDHKRRLALLVRGQAQPGGLVLYLLGPYGIGKRTAAGALSRELGQGLLVVHGEELVEAAGTAFEDAVQLALREALLQGDVLYWEGFDALLGNERRSELAVLLRQLEGRQGLTVLAGQATWEPADALRARTFVCVELPRPAYAERLHLWQISLNGAAAPVADVDLAAIATKFRFTAGQINDAVATARNLARWRDPEDGRVTAADLYTACRLQSNRKLADLAHKITPHYTWNDIVLPADRMAQLREICNTVKHRAQVYDSWGFDRKLALGKGLNVLFAGPSGTGKTMAAEIIAGELGLDLYKIDLSMVVSKYIGETEKNLARIFTEAETSNAIIFFDEADALFGKRSEVKDAHDRYANIEIAYLLQKMDEYEGVVILATNLRRNMDEAFVRRMHFAVDFPFPSEADRRRIWEKIWPAETPRGPEMDLAFMARRFDLAGGNIRNVALAAAFLAASDGQVVTPRHVLRATQREYQKMGKVIVEGEFEVDHVYTGTDCQGSPGTNPLAPAKGHRG